MHGRHGRVIFAFSARMSLVRGVPGWLVPRITCRFGSHEFTLIAPWATYAYISPDDDAHTGDRPTQRRVGSRSRVEVLPGEQTRWGPTRCMFAEWQGTRGQRMTGT